MKKDDRQPGLFDAPATPVFTRAADAHARLDHLAIELRHLKKQPSLAMRKARVIDFITALDALYPLPRKPATQALPSISDKIANALKLQEYAREIGDENQAKMLAARAQNIITAIAEDIKAERAEILPRREGYAPEKRFQKVNASSAPYVAFTRKFVEACDRQPELAETFPNLFAYANNARRYLALSDYADSISTYLKPVKEDGQNFEKYRLVLYKLLCPQSDALLQQFTLEELLKKPSADVAVSNIRFQLMDMPKKNFHHQGTLAEVEFARDQFRYESARFCRHCLEDISRYYNHDRNMIGARVKQAAEQGNTLADPCAQPGAMLDVVHQARWSLAADAVRDLVDHRYKSSLGNPALVPNSGGHVAKLEAGRGGQISLVSSSYKR